MSAALLDDVREFIRRYVVLDDGQLSAVTLWAAHTHVFDAFYSTPYLAITSAEKRSGKTRLLEVLELLVRAPLSTANISDAALFRATDRFSPTLLIDEVDSVFRARDREELRGLLCAGYRHGATAHRMGGANNRDLQSFAVYCPKCFAGIGDCLPDTILDRAISIRLKRRTRDEPIERFRLRDIEPVGHELRDRLIDWLEPQRDHLTASRPELPAELDDRAQDVWEPLLAIAGLATGAGDEPTEQARSAALALSSGEEREDASLTALLLRDVHAVFSAKGDRLRTADLIQGLSEIEESPWGDWHGKPITAHALSRMLRSYRIKTQAVWVDGGTARGYKSEQFEDVFARVLGVRSVRSVRGHSASGKPPNATNAPNAHHTGDAENSFDDIDADEIERLADRARGYLATEPSQEASAPLDADAHNAEPGGNGRPPLPGDADYLDFLDGAFGAGHVTGLERRGLRLIHLRRIRMTA